MSTADIGTNEAEEVPRHQAARDAVVERIAPRLSHDLNNQIQGVLGFAELVEGMLPPGSMERDSLGRIMQAGEKAAALLHCLTEYRHLNTRVARALDLNEIAREALRLFGHAGARGVSVELTADPDLPRVTGFPEHWLGAMLAVLTAAEDGARPTRMEIRSRRIVADELQAELTIRCTGLGPLHDGGLPGDDTFGLWLAHDVAAACGGHWSTESSHDGGTVYAWHLPAAPAADSGRNGVPAAGRGALLVESDPVVGELLLRVLFQLKFNVEARPGAATALECIEPEALGKLRLAVLDWQAPGIMPVSNIYERLRAQASDLPILILTDFAWLEDELELPAAAPVRILAKPFAPRDLIAAVESLIS